MLQIESQGTRPFSKSSTSITETQRHEREPGTNAHSIIVSLLTSARSVLQSSGTRWLSRLTTGGTDPDTARFLRMASPGVIVMLAEELLRRRREQAEQQAHIESLQLEIEQLSRRYDVAVRTLAETRSAQALRPAA